MKKVDFTHKDRNILIEAIDATAKRKAAEVAEKKAKMAATDILERLGRAFKETNKTSYVYGTIQMQGKIKAIVYKETTAQGTIDWKEVAIQLASAQGRSMEDLLEMAEGYRKSPTYRTTLDWATSKQEIELGL